MSASLPFSLHALVLKPQNHPSIYLHTFISCARSVCIRAAAGTAVEPPRMRETLSNGRTAWHRASQHTASLPPPPPQAPHELSFACVGIFCVSAKKKRRKKITTTVTCGFRLWFRLREMREAGGKWVANGGVNAVGSACSRICVRIPRRVLSRDAVCCVDLSEFSLAFRRRAAAAAAASAAAAAAESAVKAVCVCECVRLCACK